ncbi:uncharacterized protein BCR38DRAFT_466573 [Pseudomassariella vexata]|uniref:Uncharacterized protein n=1 Tax=Pseudomassariella vexata TaxID=1141098 RepID=A0A1Y2DV74_9PEZI|nr:uncharacterized protein BCR38DRAFT_466573 [Pseudomassariella vexata]ORY63147.1 hypothetical protein BCR38DRAFT_466573 [Pseudomassariella vexata]
MVAELRSIYPPEGMGIANVNGGSFYDCRLPSKLLWGPFASARDFHEALANGTDTDIVDWETAGWFLPYWEYTCCAWHVNPYNTFWQEEVGKFVAPMPHELRMEGIRRKYFGIF